MSNTLPVPPELLEWPGHTGNWGRWPNDRGTLNLVTPEVVHRGVATVQRNQVINCARPLTLEDLGHATPACTVTMLTAGVQAFEVQSAKDEMSLRTHSLINTHMDAISHYGFRNWGFNGIKFNDHVTMERGAERWDIANAGPVVTRGIFVDVARRRGVESLEPGEAVLPEDLAEAAELLEPGDAIVIRSGATLKRETTARRTGAPDYRRDLHEGTSCQGLNGDSVELLGKRDVSLIATDTPNERLPVPQPTLCRAPVHVLSLVFYGIHLVHNMDLEELGRACAEQKRHSFLFIVSPLNVPRATGSHVSPIAVL